MGDRQPSISILIPVYNVEQYLRRCLDSILGQSFGDFEVVCVNDASPDGSLDILKEYAEHDKRIKIVDKPVNEGLMRARYSAYTVAAGRYFFFCDSDDYLPENALQALYDDAETSGADITVGEMSLINKHGKKALKPRHRRIGNSAPQYLTAILNWTTCSLCGSLFKRELFENTEYTALMKHGFSEDRILLTEILLRKQPKVHSIEAPTYLYYCNTSSMTRKRLSDDRLREQLGALFRCFHKVEKNSPAHHKDNQGFIMRYLSLYIEQGYSEKTIASFSDEARQLMAFGIMRRTIGPRLAAHTWLCIHLPGYRCLMHGIRKTIRKAQGKD